MINEEATDWSNKRNKQNKTKKNKTKGVWRKRVKSCQVDLYLLWVIIEPNRISHTPTARKKKSLLLSKVNKKRKKKKGGKKKKKKVE